MKKMYFWSLLTFMMVAMLSIGFVSCGSDDDNDSSDGILVGEWQECESDGVFRNDATDYEVMHMRLRADGTGDWWSVSKGKEDSHKYSFNYSGSINGTSGTITMTITSSTNSSDIGRSQTVTVTYINEILHSGEIYYKKTNGTPKDDTDSDGNTYKSCPDNKHPHVIDLGLPSGTKWACCNVGASMPEGYGNYYAWGETQPKKTYNWNTYQYGYYKDGSRDYSHIEDIGKDIGGTTYDAATVNWGELWRTPTHEQFRELRESCSSVWTTYNGVNGLQFTGINGGTIFIPAAGHHNLAELADVGSTGFYLSSSLRITLEYWGFYFTKEIIDEDNWVLRCGGSTVRPVNN